MPWSSPRPHIMITKRDGSTVAFNRDKIVKSILAAFNAAGEAQISEVDTMAESVEACCSSGAVSEIQDCVERSLMDYGYTNVAREYIIYRHKRDEARSLRERPDSTMLSDYIFYNKYSRLDVASGHRETWDQTVDRVRDMHIRKYAPSSLALAEGKAPRSLAITNLIMESFEAVRSRRVLPSMRSMQFGGKAIEVNNCRMYNCCYGPIDHPDRMSEALYLLLSGCGVGYSVQWDHVGCLPEVSALVPAAPVVHHTIEDTIEGWASALRVGVLVPRSPAGSGPRSSYEYVEFNYSLIRPAGSVLRTSGGIAPGHLALKKMLESVRAAFCSAEGRQLRPIEVHDIMCSIADCVVSGGIRRSAMICLFSSSDSEMVYAKAHGNYEGHPSRAMANNSAVLVRGEVSRSFFDRIIALASESYGEPGFVFVSSKDEGTNPCGEIGFSGLRPESWGFCNLTEVNCAAVPSGSAGRSSFLEACRYASVIGTLQAGYTRFPFLSPRSGEQALAAPLLGVSLTGIADNPQVLQHLRDGAAVVLETNARVAKLIGLAPALQTTCVKPSGTASLLLGCAAGSHPYHARRYIRRVRVDADAACLAYAEANPSAVSDGCILFPCMVPDDATIRADLNGIDQLELVQALVRDWIIPGTRAGATSQHNVSATISVTSGNGTYHSVVDHVWNGLRFFKALAFAPMDIENNYASPPLETVSTPAQEALFNSLVLTYKAPRYLSIDNDSSPMNHAACDSERCSVVHVPK